MTDHHPSEADSPRAGGDAGHGARRGSGHPGASGSHRHRGEYVWPRERVAPRYVGGGSVGGGADDGPVTGGGDAGAPGDGGPGGPRRSQRSGRHGRRRAGQAAQRRRRRGTVFALLGLAALIAVAFIGGKALLGSFFGGPPDYSGTGDQGVVIEVAAGDSTTAIANTLYDRDVVKSAQAFLDAAQGNAAMSTIHPGYYQVKTEMSGESAVQQMTSATGRVGAVVIPEGRQLADISTVKGNTTPGILRLISNASCMDDHGSRDCLTVEQLSQALATTDPARMGVPSWAVDRVRAVQEPQRRYEGLIMAGSWNFNPTDDPATVLRTMFTQSADAFESSGISDAGSRTGLSPYDTLVAASLIEREAPPNDYPKVSRVILNRLAKGQKLQFDSTVNYALDKQEVATTDADRARTTPWNTYAMEGLPATPISAPGQKALQAAENPAPGDWLYFATVSKDGTTLFTDNYDEHLENIKKAQAAGVLDSGR
ncbi:endolytic transglycosylase MltG [Tomitella fengzijianii]|uniref:Endolytic murein transglycosylase n=1 Tax=Tomitella fengzijianii TaxID=2597660 RepID=A0A516X338_9ACTN|nr:endolytic transglycosylase MltG [Tomitella fengzijianii]QDQ97474.1 endolytic transglycosylase MltG [Tomitella fengzijianii]